MSSFTYILQQISIYYGIPVFVAGLLGGVLSTIVFLSLRTFRESSCAFYLTIMSIVNIGQLMTGLLSRIMITGYNVDWANLSSFYCKFRYFLLQTCTLLSLTCISLATIDQYLATSSNPRFQRWSNFKVAQRLIILFSIIWSLHGVLYLVYVDNIYSPLTNTTTCIILDNTLVLYHAYGYFLILTGFLPICVTIMFASMSFYNIRRSHHQNIPVIRRELDKQLTTMVLVQVAVNAVLLLPNNIILAIQRNIVSRSDPVIAAKIQFASVLTILWYYLNFTVSDDDYN
ncbi:hypothetical protein I4U23_020422 [Adineta vaga]|nr:hypothetical protein I4U23_020422 [Adineta vaga]